MGFIDSFARHRFIPALIGSMTRIIQLTGALLGTLIGFALGLALLQRAGDLIEEANRPAFLTAFVVATLLFGYLAIPYITIYPVRRAVDKLSDAGAGEFALGVAAVVIGLLMGVLVGIPLAQVGGVVGSLGPPVVALFLAFLMLAATMSKRDVLLPAFASMLPPLVKAWDDAPATDPLKTPLADPIKTLREWDFRYAQDSVATSLAIFWGEDIWRKTARDAGDENSTVYDYIVEKTTAKYLEAYERLTGRKL